jgi:transglutaminase-like putative cysteine protease
VPGKVTLVVAGLPEKFHLNSFRQLYKKLPNGQTEVTLLSAQPKVHKPRPLVDPNGGEYLKTSIIIESDAPEIRALAKKIAGDEKDALATALKVSRWVNKNLQKDYGNSSDRATDVLREMKGDCTEHSLLTVSLLRALGIPAKRIDGLVYLKNDDNVPALYWHEWVEAYVGEWMQLDPTFGQDVVDATHFALGEEARAEITPLIGSLQVLEVR